MSGISSINTSSLEKYYQQLEQALAEQEQAKADSAASTADTMKTSDTATTSDTSSTTTTSLKDKVRLAIMAAVQKAENSGEDSDLLSVISDAVDQTLKDAGIDPSKALDSDKVDDSTKALLKSLQNSVKSESETLEVLAAMQQQSDNLFSILGNQSNQNLSGYLFDSTQ